MVEFIRQYGFWILCGYGVAAAVLFTAVAKLRDSTLTLYAYLVLYVLLFGFYAPAPVGRYGPFGVIVAIVHGLIISAFNGVALYYCADRFLGQLGRSLAGLNRIVLRKSYDRAEGAEARGDLEEAEALYRAELESDPADLVARRRLAEVLLKRGRPEEAARELRTVLERAEQRERRYAVAFRLAEVLQDELGEKAAAEELYFMIVREDPNGPHARYARSRLGGGEASEAPTDFWEE
ncbi:MAG: tetratricopeptide repeat protein [Planctomycetota bacterium]|jgi:tetratricopeptide (TPR) repeat protein